MLQAVSFGSALFSKVFVLVCRGEMLTPNMESWTPVLAVGTTAVIFRLIARILFEENGFATPIFKILVRYYCSYILQNFVIS